MAFSLTLDLSDRDLAHFQKVKEASRKAAGDKSEPEILECASRLLADAQKAEIPDFIAQRLLRLADLIAMVRDEAWAMSGEDRERVLSALVYFCDPDDVIPDRVEVLGLLDDAIMIELAVRELGHELDAYDDFCDFRQHQATRRGVEPGKVGRADWLDSRREELVDRMHERRRRDRERGLGVGYGSSSGYGSGKSYVRAWRPGMFKFT
jgi:uncharacterized membrane protein YkvA (DUF1232 family)